MLHDHGTLFEDAMNWLKDAIKNIPDSPCGRAFRNAMLECSYGDEETWDAWCWFRDGWEECEQRLTTRNP